MRELPPPGKPTLKPGWAARIPAYTEKKGTHLVMIAGAVAKRCQFLRYQAHEDKMCNAFYDPEDHEVYLQGWDGLPPNCPEYYDPWLIQVELPCLG